MYVILRAVKVPRLLFPCQMSVALQEGLSFIGTQNPTLVQTFTYIETDSVILSPFVQSLIFVHILCGLLNPLAT